MTSVLTIENETRVNTYTSDNQTASAIARRSDGSYVVAWQSMDQDGDSGGIYFQRFDVNGVALGAETRANTYTTSAQLLPAITVLTGGGFVVTWQSDQDASPNNIYARVYSATGTAVTAEFRVNTTTADNQNLSKVASLSNGGYVIVWQSEGQDGSTTGIYSQRYNAANVALGAETRVNAYTTNAQTGATVTGLVGGGYVVTWTSDGQDGSEEGTYARVYSSTGTGGSEFRVNTTVAGRQYNSDVTALAGGGFVVIWQGPDPSVTGTYARVYEANGTPVGAERRINTETNDSQSAGKAAGLTDGGFVVVWHSYFQDGDVFGIYAQRCDAFGNALGPEFLVNAYTAETQSQPAVAALNDGGFVITWQTSDLDGSGTAIYKKEYSAATSLTGTQSVYGTSDADTLDGGSGADKMYGGFGNDVYVVNASSDLVSEEAGQGDDEVRSSLSYSLGANVENLSLTGTSAINATGNTLANIIAGNAGNNRLFGNGADDQITGGSGHDSVEGGDGDDYVEGNTGNDTLWGLDGDDDLFGGDGGDTLDGGIGSDEIEAGSGNDTVDGGQGDDVIDGGTGNDLIRFSRGSDYAEGGAGSDTLSAEIYGIAVTASLFDETMSDILGNVVTFQGIENLKGSPFGDDLVGNAAGNVIDGGLGQDTMAGLGGNDTYLVDNIGDSVFEAAGGGTDLIRAAVSFSLVGIQVEHIALLGGENLIATGNNVGNQLLGNSGDNLLDGGVGSDTLTGGLGNDIYIIDSATDVIQEALGAGIDEVRTQVSYTLASDVDLLTLLGIAVSGTGNAGNNILTGNASGNVLNGGGGNDTLVGGLGDDTYDVDSATVNVVEQAAEGSDTVRASVNYTLGANIEALILAGDLAVSGSGNALNNTITGTTGNNILNGGIGSDTLIGGLGDDSYIIDETTDNVVEANGQGTDIILASASYSLNGRYVETLQLTGSNDINGTGNSLSNSLIGNIGNNILNGSAGIDTMSGGLGNDSYYVDHVSDNVVEAAGEGTDLVFSTVTYTLVGRNAENLTLTGSAVISATGNGLGNILVGNSGNNTLNGGGSNDTLTGGLGADFFQFSAGFRADTVTDFNSGQGDKIQLVGLGSYTVTQVGANVTVDFGAGNIITVLTATAADVSANIV